MNYELDVTVQHHFTASHSLPMRQEVHTHEWQVEFTVTGTINPETGMLCDMLELSDFFKPYVMALDGTVLHQAKALAGSHPMDKLARKFPTCDTLAHHFLRTTTQALKEHKPLSHLKLTCVAIRIYEPESDVPWGWARIRPA